MMHVTFRRTPLGLWLTSALALLTACTDPSDKNVVAQVGSARLSVAEVRLSVPMDKSGQDSLNYVYQYVDEWVNEQMLYEQGRQNLPNLHELEEQVEGYRRRLIAQSYENELLRERLGEVSDEECLRYYEAHNASMRLSGPVIRCLSVRLPARSTRLETVRRWMKELCDGNDDSLEELETYCTQHGVDLDNGLMQWSAPSRLTGRISASIPAPTAPTRRPQEVKDGDVVLLYIVRDSRSAGDVQPYEYARPAIRQQLAQQRRSEFHRRLLHDLRAEGERTGFVKINLKKEQ